MDEIISFKKQSMKNPSKYENSLHLTIGDSPQATRDTKKVSTSLYLKFSPLYISGQADDNFYASFGQNHSPSIKFKEHKSEHDSGVELLSSGRTTRFEHTVLQPLNVLSTDARCYIDNISNIRESATARAVAFLRAYESQLELLLANYSFLSNHQTSSNASGVHEINTDIGSRRGSVSGSACPVPLEDVISHLRGNLTMLVTIVSTFYPSVPTSIQFIVQSIMEHCDHLEEQIGHVCKDSTSIIDSDAVNITPPISSGFTSSLAIAHTGTADAISRLSHNSLDQTPHTPNMRFSSTNMAQTLCSMPRSIVKADEWNESCDRPDRQLFLKKITSMPGNCISEKSSTENTSSNFNLFNEPTELSDKDTDKPSSVDILKTLPGSPIKSTMKKAPQTTIKNVPPDISHTEATSESAENVEGQVQGNINISTVTNTATITRLPLGDSPSAQKSVSDVMTLTKIRSIPGPQSQAAESQMAVSPLIDMVGDDVDNKLGNKLKTNQNKTTVTTSLNDGSAGYPFAPGRSEADDTVNKTLDIGGGMFTSAETIIHNVLDFVKLLYNERIVKASNDIYVELSRRIKQNDCVIVFGKSRMILKALMMAHIRLQAETDSRACFEVICIDASECQCGLDILKKLSQVGIPCFYGLLTSLPLFIKHATKVIMGAYSVSLNGSIQGRAGASLIANIAKFYRIPLIIACETYKVTDQIYINALSNNVLQDTGTFTLSQTDKMRIIKPLYDVVDTKLISCIITEYGPISPDSLREQLK